MTQYKMTSEIYYNIAEKLRDILETEYNIFIMKERLHSLVRILERDAKAIQKMEDRIDKLHR